MKEINMYRFIGNATYKIFFINNDLDERLYLKEDESYHFGITDFKKEEIYINNNLSNNKKKQTLIHEITHAYINEYGFKSTDYFNEEQLCEFMAMQGDNILLTSTSVLEEYNIKTKYDVKQDNEMEEGIDDNKRTKTNE